MVRKCPQKLCKYHGPDVYNVPFYGAGAWSVVPDLRLNFGSYPTLPDHRLGQEEYLSSTCHRLSNLTALPTSLPVRPEPSTSRSTANVPGDLDLLAVACATSGAVSAEVAFGSPSLDKENNPSSRRSRSGKYTSSFTKVASRILNTWFLRNQSCPYPSQETVKCLAEACNLEKEQVRKWFQNKRNRTGTSMKPTNRRVMKDTTNIRL